MDIDEDICGQLEDTRGSLWIFVDICGYSIQSYLHAGRPAYTQCPSESRKLGGPAAVRGRLGGRVILHEAHLTF